MDPRNLKTQYVCLAILRAFLEPQPYLLMGFPMGPIILKIIFLISHFRAFLEP
jgi:hypothetical protein